MYAIVRISGFQYLVREGDVVNVPRLDLEPGSRIAFDDVLFVRTKDRAVVGRPRVEESRVEAEVIGHARTTKVTALKFRRRENYRRKLGHRQSLTKIRIERILFSG
ncbi:MAG: 50S ribosomal protein L21 [candidate division WOR-3 bacterium]